MIFITQNLSCITFLISTCLCFHKSFGAIEEDKFTYLKMIAMDNDQNVYHKFSVHHKRNHILTCGAKCGIDESCIGIDVCDGRICRLWNATIYQSISANNSNELCKRYIKVIIFLYLRLVLFFHVYC